MNYLRGALALSALLIGVAPSRGQERDTRLVIGSAQEDGQNPGSDGAELPIPETASNTPPSSWDLGAGDLRCPATAWGIAGFRFVPAGVRTAPNGLPFDPLFSLDLDLDLWLWPSQGVYLFTEERFWGQEAALGITNRHQGAFDFSKRELDLSLGAAWNYAGAFEARVFAYSFNNLNRGKSPGTPSGFEDGAGLENRYYLSDEYARLGTKDYDLAKSSFLSLGYYPAKDWIDEDGHSFRPGPFARAYLTCDVCDERYYLYVDTRLIAQKPFPLKLLHLDFGVGMRPFSSTARCELRLGVENTYDFGVGDWHPLWYGAVRLNF
jgi:hypothetical protein